MSLWVINMSKIITHPFREGVLNLLKQHFSDDIIKNFILTFEAETFNTNYLEDVWRQKRNNEFVMEIRYRNPDESMEFICDVYSWDTRSYTEHLLLNRISDAFKAGKIGKDWMAQGEKIGINKGIISGMYETPDEKEHPFK